MAKRKWIRVGFDLKPIPPPEAPRWEIDTREKAIARLIRLLSPESRQVVRDTKREDLILFHLSSWGMGIRKELGLWGQNVYLLRDLSPDQPIHADDASMILIRAVWERLQKQGANPAAPESSADRPRE
jgi:hypothetical protein